MYFPIYPFNCSSAVLACQVQYLNGTSQYHVYGFVYF
jgi:hypothetical protein